jgi:NAD(P)-dependent dehydrogenase (short-subunit alcohol dehydrogenase family)
MTYSLDGKKVLVTGASSGIGAALAEGFAERGAVVGICARREDRLRDVLERLRKHSPESRSWVVDLSGIPKRRRVTELSPEVVDAVMAVNYLSPVRLTLALLPGLIDRRGRIVNISSIAARLGPGTEAAYSASKAALTAWSEGVAIDLADTGVKVHIVNPAIIDTDLFRLPDNDEPIADMSMALPVEAIVQPVVDQLDSGTFEIYVPEWFQEVVAGKVADPDGFQQGTIEYLRTRGALG